MVSPLKQLGDEHRTDSAQQRPLPSQADRGGEVRGVTSFYELYRCLTPMGTNSS